MGSTHIFSSPRPDPRLPWTLALAFVAIVAVACVVEAGSGDGLILLFGVPAAALGALAGRWWAVAVPVALTTAAVAAGIECSVSESPQALMLAGSTLGVAARRVGDRWAVGR